MQHADAWTLRGIPGVDGVVMFLAQIHAMPLMVVALCVLAIAYRYYSAFLAARVMVLSDERVTPAHRLNDGHNYCPTSKWVLFGHHFAAISGAGPLIGPVLAAQFGWMPGYIWLLVGVVIGGAVQDFVVLTASIRRNGRSLAEIARQEIGTFGGTVTAVAILFIVIIALAGLGSAVVNALAESAWGSFTIFCSIPIALFMGWYMYVFRKGAVVEASVIGVILLLLAVWAGQFAQTQPWGKHFFLTRNQIVFALGAYGFLASILPVWLLLCPRDYLSAFMKIGTIGALVIGVIVVNPVLHIPAVTEFASSGKGPIFAGKVFPMVFITIMCGAISGFHALVSSGTTPKMIMKESHARPIGYGCMLIESLVGIVALMAVAGLDPNDYYLINTPPARVAQYDFHAVDLHDLEAEVGEHLQGRTGGAPTLAVGMARIFSNISWLTDGQAMAIWYHFAIMFEALFILTTIDAGTRIASFLFQEFLAKPRFVAQWMRHLERADWLTGVFISLLLVVLAWKVGIKMGHVRWTLCIGSLLVVSLWTVRLMVGPGAWIQCISSALVVLAWAAFLWSGSIATIWPMFGIANQMLAAIALAIVSTLLVNAGRARYCWVTLLPMCWVLITTTTGGLTQIQLQFWPMVSNAAASTGDIIKGWMNIGLICVMIGCAAIIVVQCGRRWVVGIRIPPPMCVPGVVE